MKKYKRICKSFFLISICLTTNQSYGHSIEQVGDFLLVALPAYTFGRTMQEPDYTGAKQFAYSFGGALLTQVAIKELEIEQRPNGADRKSFPSGHAQSAFSGATFIHKRYGLKQAIVPYLLAGFVGYSRVHANAHYWHDVVAGAAISGLWTWVIVDGQDNGTHIGFSGGAGGARLDFNMKF